MTQPAAASARPGSTPPVPLTAVVAWTGATLRPAAAGATPVTGVSLSSQRVHPGDLYAALPGARVHGARFARDALASGAVAVLTDPEGASLLEELLPDGVPVPVLVVERPRAVLGDLAARVYAEPARALRLVAVTGTQGKTTTTRLLDGALTAAGVPSAVIGTVGTRIRGRDIATGLTTPEAPDLHALFAVMVEEGVRACTMEVSSHALVMGRVDGVRFDVAGFLNLGRDHLDFHRDEEDYFAAKASLFTPERAARGVVNVDDPWGRRLLRVTQVPVVTCSVGGDADWRAVDVEQGPAGSSFTVVGPDGGAHRAHVPLAGSFNVANALCAVALAGEAGLDAAAVAAGMAEAGGVPGRLERVEAGQDYLALVDYAHKPDAVTAVLEALRPATEGRLLLVIGAGGDRDTGKRPVMGEIAARLADVVVVTDDNPRTEDPASIRLEVLRGARSVPGGADIVEVADRRDAIRHVVALAGPGDTVVVAGKGHETGQTVGATTHPFDDRVELRRAIEEAGS
ncbi:UDP-N-acetylmuramoyl-L-alanyl-D-glutamate--2,6-diaminopimelate ligase [Nocardioides aequoreus]|uniref:UDP-N-acetylmuramoyl-L-alanyl-D-glutamate--2, 6-diaminopimelate ligase n=1 Tax=Nocardioides aequoreus TaxID=397278 RepID=UPI0004C448BF|nr:UDP-N-acetylmuramoyl-L-alanyl-D-glutamate--2,6-diaminopimelate ligase [Nocardioides aequoreus]